MGRESRIRQALKEKYMRSKIEIYDVHEYFDPSEDGAPNPVFVHEDPESHKIEAIARQLLIHTIDNSTGEALDVLTCYPLDRIVFKVYKPQ